MGIQNKKTDEQEMAKYIKKNENYIDLTGIL